MNRRWDTYGDRFAVDIDLELIAEGLRCAEAYVQVPRKARWVKVSNYTSLNIFASNLLLVWGASREACVAGTCSPSLCWCYLATKKAFYSPCLIMFLVRLLFSVWIIYDDQRWFEKPKLRCLEHKWTSQTTLPIRFFFFLIIYKLTLNHMLLI